LIPKPEGGAILTGTQLDSASTGTSHPMDIVAFDYSDNCDLEWMQKAHKFHDNIASGWSNYIPLLVDEQLHLFYNESLENLEKLKQGIDLEETTASKKLELIHRSVDSAGEISKPTLIDKPDDYKVLVWPSEYIRIGDNGFLINAYWGSKSCFLKISEL
jgi:hypothetical protein